MKMQPRGRFLSENLLKGRVNKGFSDFGINKQEEILTRL
jgi:hypothetical protein